MEAHACDEWAIYSHVLYQAPKTMQQRMALAKEFYDLATRAGCQELGQDNCLVDGIDDAAAKHFAAFPERLYVLRPDCQVAFKGNLGPDGYSVKDLEQFLNNELKL